VEGVVWLSNVDIADVEWADPQSASSRDTDSSFNSTSHTHSARLLVLLL